LRETILKAASHSPADQTRTTHHVAFGARCHIHHVASGARPGIQAAGTDSLAVSSTVAAFLRRWPQRLTGFSPAFQDPAPSVPEVV
jgi:hypothetical protein